MLRQWISAGFALLVLIGPAAAQEDELRAKVEQAQSRYEQAWTAGDADAVAQLFAEDAVFWPVDGGVFEGRDQIRQAIQEDPTPTAAEIRSTRTERLGDLVLDVGTFTVTFPEPRGRMEGEYIVLADETEDSVRIRRLIGFPPRRAAGQ